MDWECLDADPGGQLRAWGRSCLAYLDLTNADSKRLLHNASAVGLILVIF